MLAWDWWPGQVDFVREGNTSFGKVVSSQARLPTGAAGPSVVANREWAQEKNKGRDAKEKKKKKFLCQKFSPLSHVLVCEVA